MKKMFRFSGMAALAMVGAMTVGCSGDDDILDEVQPESEDKVVTMTTTVRFDDSTEATTRALTAAGVKTFVAGDKIAVQYQNTVNKNYALAVSEPLKDDDITNEGKSARFTVTLTNPKANGYCWYVYPASIARNDGIDGADNNKLNTQDGNLLTIGNNLDAAATWGQLTSEAMLPDNVFTLENLYAIAMFTIKNSNGADITSTITRLDFTKVEPSPLSGLPDITTTYTVNRAATAGPIYMALYPVSSNERLTITAYAGSTSYSKSVTGKTLTAGHMYPITVTTTLPVPQSNYISLSQVTNADVGKVICSDGSVCNYSQRGSKTPKALIFYVGNAGETNSTYNHGLAIALSDCSSKGEWGGMGTDQSTFPNISDITAADADLAGIAHTNTMKDLPSYSPNSPMAGKVAQEYGATISGTSGWFLPTLGQWNLFFNYCGYKLTSFDAANDGNIFTMGSPAYNAYSDKLTDVGGDGFPDSYCYWTSSENNNNAALGLLFKWKGGVGVSIQHKSAKHDIRPFLAW